MGPRFLLIMLLCFCCSLYAQDIPTPYEPRFTSAPSLTTQFDFDLSDSSLADTGNIHELYYRDDGATSWSSAPVSLLYTACTTFTYSGQTGYQPPSGILEWYLRSENDTAVVSQCPINSADQFPVPMYLMADLGADSIGDPEGTSNTFLDITHFYGGYSDTKLYFRFDNNGGGFPQNQGLFTYFIYSVGVIDPDATDSSAYVLVYANVPAFLSSGLYRLDPADSSFTSIGSISTNISGNSLWMSCNIADLTAQPGWSDWPPPTGFVGAAAVTATAVLTDVTTNDMSKAGVLAPVSNFLDFNQANTAPVLDAPLVTSETDGSIHAEITYTDGENHLAFERKLIFDGNTLPMTACVKDYQAGTVFEYDHQVSDSGWYDYYFEFSDGVEVVSTQVDSIYVEIGPAYICGDSNGDETVNVSDAVFIINFVFAGGGTPDPLESADPNCDTLVNVSDAVWIINFVFAGGNDPCDVNGDGQPDC